MKPSTCKRSFKSVRHQGFSLLELLIVMVILLIVMAAVLGTLTLVQRTSFSNSQLVDTRQNVRAASKLLYDDIVTLGELYMDQTRGAPIDQSWVLCRAGFLRSLGFPNPTPAAFPNGIYTNATNHYDLLFGLQGANNVGTGGTPVTTLGYNDPANTDPWDDPQNFQIYSGSGPVSTIAQTDHRGTDQILIMQPEYLDLRFNDNTSTPADPDTNPDVLEAQFQAIARFSGSTLQLDPILTTPIRSNISNPNQLADPTDALLSNRLEAMVDCVVLQFNGGPKFIGLVTDVDTASGRVTLGGPGVDPIGINPNWSIAQTPVVAPPQPTLCPNNATINVNRVKLVHYYIATPKTALAGAPPNFSALYRREGAVVRPLAYNIENMQIRYLLIDETPLAGQPKGRLIGDVEDLENDPRLANAADVGRTTIYPYWNRTAMRAMKITLYGRSEERETRANLGDGTLSLPIDRRYYRVSKEISIALRNASYDKSA